MFVQQFHNTITLRAVFGNMARPRHVLLVIKDKQGRYLLGAKPELYPPGIYRFSGGGVEQNERPLQAALREAQEELGLSLRENQLTPIAEIITQATFQDKQLQNRTTLFLLALDDSQTIVPGDDIAYLQPHTPQELQALIQRYRSFPPDEVSQDGDYQVFWQDYGAMYAFIHQVALDVTQ